MSVDDIKLNMTFAELQQWVTFFERHPIGWREDLRILRVLQAMGIKEKPAAIFPSLKTPVCTDNLNVSSLLSSTLFSKMAGAVGGDSLDFLKG